MEPLDHTLRQSKSLLWGVSIALSWTWGIGIFFSVQMAVQFGILGLTSFALVNATGLLLFGLFTQVIARRFTSPAGFERHFFQTARGLRGAFYLYQFIAITLTLHAIMRYLFWPMGFPVPLVALMVLGITFFLGEEFSIARIKYLHAYVMLGVVIAMAALLWLVLPNSVAPWSGGQYLDKITRVLSMQGHQTTYDSYFAYFMIPIAVGFFLGPWLDLQQWQRAVQINREGLSIGGSYVCGAIIFFCIIMFHGVLALTIYNANIGYATLVVPSADGLFHAKDVLTRFFLWPDNPVLYAVGFYIGFICLLALTTFDSGYIALRWFLDDSVKRSQSSLMALLPTRLLTSPLPWFFVAAMVAVAGTYLNLEVEYFASFYASFLVVYTVIFYRRAMSDKVPLEAPAMKLFSVALFSIALFAVGYFRELGLLMAIASLIPFFYGMYLTSPAKRRAESGRTDQKRAAKNEDETTVDGDGVATSAVASESPMNAGNSASNLPAVSDGNPLAPIAPGGLASTYFEGKWFVHRFVATYSDTNSVGNVYFGQYAMWVGKTRELFFHHCMPDFDLKKTHFFILTRAFEHKFITEAREFETIVVRIRVSGTNRKFCTLDHQIHNGEGQLLGKGSQTLLFVSSSDYKIIDIPQEAQLAFVPYI